MQGSSLIWSYYEKTAAGDDVRKNLIALRAALKDEAEKKKFAYRLEGNISVLVSLLSHEDPKVRKNAARLLGEMETEDVLPFLFRAYQTEEVRYVRADYLEAMEGLDISEYLGELKESLKKLDETEENNDNRKHLRREKLLLRRLVHRDEIFSRRKFDGFGQKGDIILLTGAEQREITAQQVTAGKITLLGTGVKVLGADLLEIQKIRTWSQILFLPPEGSGKGLLRKNPSEAALDLASMNLPEWLDTLHSLPSDASGKPERKLPYYYRLEVKGIADRTEKDTLTRLLADELDVLSGGRLCNDPSDYEIEIRLILRGDDMFVPMIRMMLFKDRRFAYFKDRIPEALNPVRAALVCRLIEPYLKEGARVLDPFCGVGTLLTERGRLKKPHALFGTDIYEPAVIGARKNAERAKLPVHYVNRNFFDFTSKEPFDEIITDMPRSSAAGMTVPAIYDRFFETVPKVLGEDACLFLLSARKDLIGKAFSKYPFCRKAAEFCVDRKNDMRLFVIKCGGEISGR